eukprot:4711850-Pleurochrysis_carterae.AAC.4
MRRACGGVNAFVCEEFGKLLREEFAGIIAVECANNTCRSSATFVQQGCESSQESSDMGRCLTFVAQHVYRFETRVIVHNHEGVAASSVDGG